MAGKIGKLFEFISLIGQLKRIKRTGWVLRKVTDPESVADHMYRMGVMAFLIDPGSGLSKEKCIKMSLVHDMAESIVGDLTPSDGVDKEEKHRREKTALMHICSLVSDDVGAELMSLWQEYEEQKTPESHYVMDLDKFDMIFQAYEYEQIDNKPGFLQEFFDSTSGKFQTERVQTWARELEELRNQSVSNQIFQSPELCRLKSLSSREAAVKPYRHLESDAPKK
ncbi:hypothetical protein ACJMK2_001452 [Sinanodonta woodiana]|uniref:5'-deoxynucleotidase HDDC2 n=1 Tax=Sinanodonta woodiana TaxID=1069815 RepID=A0ABD3XU49_SINWO